MNFSQRSRAALGSACTVAALALGVPLAAAAPYTDDALLTISTYNPVTGGTLTITLVNFETGELVDIDLHSTVVRLATVQTDGAGGGTTTITLPPNFVCQHYLTATGRNSGETARTNIVIGPPENCGNVGNGNPGHGNVGNGNPGNGNRGNGNTGDGNVGNGNTGSGNVGNGNNGDGNVGNGNNPYGGAAMTRWGNVAYDRPATAPESNASELALVSITGLAAVGGVGFLHRRRRRT